MSVLDHARFPHSNGSVETRHPDHALMLVDCRKSTAQKPFVTSSRRPEITPRRLVEETLTCAGACHASLPLTANPCV